MHIQKIFLCKTNTNVIVKIVLVFTANTKDLESILKITLNN